MTIPCIECGGKTRFNHNLKLIVCESCGLSFNRGEVEETRQKMRKAIDYYDDNKREEHSYKKKKRRNKDYLEWWSSQHEE